MENLLSTCRTHYRVQIVHRPTAHCKSLLHQRPLSKKILIFSMLLEMKINDTTDIKFVTLRQMLHHAHQLRRLFRKGLIVVIT